DFSNFLGGKSFSNDLLPAIAPQMQFVATRQDFKAAGVAAPTTQLPAGALVVRIKPGQQKAVRGPLRLLFQSIVTFVNLDAAQKGRPALELKDETRGPAEVRYAVYE